MFNAYKLIQITSTQFILPIVCGVIANWLYDVVADPRLKDFMKKLFCSRKPPHTSRAPRRKHGCAARVAVFTLVTIMTMVVMAILTRQAEYIPVLLQPLDGEHVGNTFDVRGKVGRVGEVGEDRYIYVVVHDTEKAGAPWIITDMTMISPNGWWIGKGRVPDSVKYDGELSVYAFRADSPRLYQIMEALSVPPMPPKKGGETDVVTVRKIGS